VRHETLKLTRLVSCHRSVDLAWDLLMDSKYAALQQVLYTSSSELDRFRQLVVNVSLFLPIYLIVMILIDG
jgi:hypothetical protein